MDEKMAIIGAVPFVGGIGVTSIALPSEAQLPGWIF